MNKLEKEFKEFLIKHKQVSDSTITIGEAKALAHDLAEIANKYYEKIAKKYKESMQVFEFIAKNADRLGSD